MDPTIQAELERQQSAMLDKLSSIMDNKLDSMKRKLEESSNTQMSELKKIRLSEPRSFKKKGHEQQYKYNQQVKSVVNDAKEAAIEGKTHACIAKLDEGIDLIDQRQKLILIADRSEYGWKTVGEYLDNELADDEQDAKKMKKAEKEAQRKIAESRAVKAVKARTWYKTSRAPGATATSPSPSPLALSTGSLPSRFYPSVGSTRSIGSFTFTNGTAQKRGTCFSCGKPGHWRNECPVLVTGQTHQEGRKAAGQQVGQVFPQAGAFYMQPLAQAGQRPFFTPQMQQVCPHWQPMQPQQQVRQPGMQGMPGAGQVPRARGICQVPPSGVPGQQQAAGAGGPNQRMAGGMAQPQQVRGPGMQGQGQRPAYKFQQNVHNQPAQGHPGGVPMQPHEQVPRTINIPGQNPLDPSVLAAASPQDQKQMLGECLFPLIQATHPDQAGKITGMLLEIDNAELLHMLDSQEALNAKTQEAVSVLRAHSAKEKATEMKN